MKRFSHVMKTDRDAAVWLCRLQCRLAAVVELVRGWFCKVFMPKKKNQVIGLPVSPAEGAAPTVEVVQAGTAESIAFNVRYGFKQQDFLPLARDLSITTSLSEEVTLGFLQRGHAILLQHVELGRKYITLCEFIREHAIGPAQAREMLFALGFHKVRVSEILRIATCADEIWNKYRARELSMQKVLQIERGGAVLETLDLDADEKDLAGVGEGSENGVSSGSGDGRKVSTHAAKVNKLVKVLQALCGKEWARYKKGREYVNAGNGIVVTIEYIPLESAMPSRDAGQLSAAAAEKAGAK